jgi:hypothetical protein
MAGAMEWSEQGPALVKDEVPAKLASGGWDTVRPALAIIVR